MKTRVAVVGATGWTGGATISFLLRHPELVIAHLSARTPRAIEEVFPSLRGAPLPPVRAFDPDEVAREAEWAFLCLPHGTAREAAAALAARGMGVVDLSADLRLVAGSEARNGGGLPAKIPYGLPELFRADLEAARKEGVRVVSNPGCYPTSIQLAAAPVLAAGLGDPGTIFVHAASGVSGAGRALRPDLLFVEHDEDYRPYGLPRHRHLDEIEHHLGRAAGRSVRVTFVPHLLPARRGILSCIVLRSDAPDAGAVRAVWREAYRDAPFVRVLPDGTLPSLRAVVGTNFCDLACHADPATGTLVLFAAICNLGKGAGGQAVQNFNILTGRDETMGLLPPVGV